MSILPRTTFRIGPAERDSCSRSSSSSLTGRPPAEPRDVPSQPGQNSKATDEHGSGWRARSDSSGAPDVSLLFTSDHHFGHSGARGLFKRPFGSVAEMDATMVARWNEVAGAEDEVWHLGDFAVRQRPDRMAQLLEALAGTKHLIAGNNDGPATAALAGWASVGTYRELEVDGTWLTLCHYPLRTWNHMGRGAINLHGHSHGRLAPLPRQVDVGVDCWDFRPITLEQIRNQLSWRGRARRP
jgi:calcineurin-like phosphoesterase family protein